MIARILGALKSIPEAVVGGARQAMREHVQSEVDRVLCGIFEPGVESYTFRAKRSLDDEPPHTVTLSPDDLLTVVAAMRDRFKAEL